MGLLDEIEGSRVYLDTNVFIYAVEGFDRFNEVISTLFSAIDRGEIEAITSELTLAEALVEPFREGNERYQQIYRETLQDRASFRLVPVTRPLLVESARLRASTGLRLPDAIHLATAREAECTTLVANDDDFEDAPEMNVVILSEVISDSS
ncbi:MAG: type II toxin-antitoxin system VapC family toxin [Salinibacter sp.]|uniref:type II toxin-antitoxin system VapC family toxin n=1 Tax=Salinibacter sp. TaxID=2065818 RepID=UPI0035D528DB